MTEAIIYIKKKNGEKTTKKLSDKLGECTFKLRDITFTHGSDETYDVVIRPKKVVSPAIYVKPGRVEVINICDQAEVTVSHLPINSRLILE